MQEVQGAAEKIMGGGGEELAVEGRVEQGR